MRFIIIAGQGIRIGNNVNRFRRFIDTHGIPFVTTKLAIDLYPESKHYKGMIGVRGNYKIPKGCNLVCVGTSLSLATRGYNNELTTDNKIVFYGTFRQFIT